MPEVKEKYAQIKLTKKPLADIKDYERNNKIHPDIQKDWLEKAIQKFGYKNPIVIDKNDVIVAGHCRREVLDRLWYTHASVIVADDLTEEEIMEERLLDNRIAELAQNHRENIEFELTILQNADLNELYNFDFKTDEQEEQEDIEDELPPIDDKEEPIVKEGDMFQLGNHILRCGDSMNEDDIKALLEGSEGKTHCISDPPYEISYNPDNHDMIRNDDKLLDYTELAQKYSDGYFCMWTGYQVVDEWVAMVKETFGKVTNMIIWHK